jgi:hypothetical protein
MLLVFSFGDSGYMNSWEIILSWQKGITQLGMASWVRHVTRTSLLLRRCCHWSRNKTRWQSRR